MLIKPLFFLLSIFCLTILVNTNEIKRFEKRQNGKSQSTKSASSSKGNGGGKVTISAGTYDWPMVDGTLKEAYALLNATPTVLEVGYWYFTVEFYEKFLQVGNQDPKKASDLVFEQIVQFNQEFGQTCFQITNNSANQFGRKNTLGRMIAFPFNLASLQIDQDGIAIPAEFGCWERDLNGDPNKPLFDYTDQILRQYKWDKPTAIQEVKKIIKALGLDTPPSSTHKKHH